MWNLNLIVKAVKIGEVRSWVSKKDGSEHLVAEALVGDETGTVLLTLWDDQIKMVEKDSVYEIRNGYTSLFKGFLRLNIGKHGSIRKSSKVIEEVNHENNLSERLHQPAYWFSPASRPFRRRRRRR
ncbi:single-stranded DNA-binding protein [Candidatus Bathyarchaeota archaeon]|nr:MAG: single-stranded DNA-binding protein [Candidatus Bathyarchaeota archaeon]RLI23406.1 MAG: single-stranded DNA-binding protein [Candidatus Bathyarchaeota archaeon]